MALYDLHVDFAFDFQQLDEALLDHSIVGKPWGFYKTTVLNEYYQLKVLHLLPKASISLQRHKLREEYWLTVFGSGEAQIGDSAVSLYVGNYIFIPENCQHRLKNTDDSRSLLVVEVQIGQSFDENDIERIVDEYGRS